MSGWLYLIRNKDIYKIGITKNFNHRMRQLKPDNVVAKLYTREYLKLEKELHNRYKHFRIPQTEYFRLNNSHLKEIKNKYFETDYNGIVSLIILLRIFLQLSFTFFIIYFILSLNINEPKIIIMNSLLLMNRILLYFSFFTLFLPSGKNFIFLNELKYRSVRLLIYSLFAIFTQIAYIYST